MTLTKVEGQEGERYRLEVTKSNSRKSEPLGASQQEGRWDFDKNPPAFPPARKAICPRACRRGTSRRPVRTRSRGAGRNYHPQRPRSVWCWAREIG
jgi:hypothetical protein